MAGPRSRSKLAAPPLGHYLLIFTRDLEKSASARYLLRHAATLGREGHRLTLVLTGDAACAPGAQRARYLQTARVCVLTDSAALPVGSPGSTWFEPATEAELSALMLTPGIQTCWC